ncbi:MULTISPECIES: helix-turn-helix domain-containing protein [unclassified Variovorax]|uniref:helix-turn-helix domain-containing protein n=1 Tax=unclassified Variovorax TaxID=663243 RepID=UPI003ED06195
MRSNQDPALLQAFAAELKVRRASLGINQDELAYESGVNRSFVAKLEVGTSSPSLTTLFRIAEGLHAQPADLIQSVSKRYQKELRAARRSAWERGAKTK